MKEEILKRAMFAMPLSKKAQGTGIMAGFDMDEMDSEEEDLKEMPPMARTPQNPEILMNTLRGDMRSVDARYQELADMVGEEAAMETPPEVLAMLQPKFATPPEGIGALPQAQAMMPPGAGMPPPDQMGAPQPAPAMPQGGIPMPEGMESAPPFSPGAEEAPQGYAIGGIVRGAQVLGARGVDALGRGAQQANQYLGNMFMSPQPTLQRMTGGTPPMNLVVPANQSLVQAPSGAIAQGVGGQLTPYMGMGPLTAPTFTQGLATGARQVAEQFPRAADALKTMFPMAALGAATLQSVGSRKPVDPEAEAREARRLADIDKIPTKDVPVVAPIVPKIPVAPMLSAVSEKPVAVAEEEQAAIDDKQLITSDKTNADSLSSFIDKKLKPSSKIDRIKAGQAEYAPLFEELLGSDKESAKINALLLLSEAGLKLASTAKPTFAMAVAESFSGVPRGFAAIAAQERELGMKVKTAALQQAITDVDAQDKYAQQLQIQVLKGDYELLKEREKQSAKGNILEDAGLGGRASKTKDGSFLGFSIDPNDPAVTSAIQSRYTLRQTDNPFVSNMGEAPTTIVTDKAARLELGSTLSAHNNSLKSIEIAKNSLSQLYSPGTFFVDKVNNLIVPVDFTGVIRPDLNQEAAKSTLMTLQNTLSKSIASANNSGRTAVQEQEWARQLTAAIADPTAFFKDRELAAKTLTAIETSIRNARQETLTQLGFEGNDYVMRTPNTGTKSDPFSISADPAEQKIMYNFLAGTVGKLQDPKAFVHLRMPNGQVQQFTPTQLRAQNK